MMDQSQCNIIIPNADYFLQLINCRNACPVNTNSGGYVRKIFEGEEKDGFSFARLPNPFASVCGRICAHPCEDKCRRKKIDQSISIRALKRYLTEKFGSESPYQNNYVLKLITGKLLSEKKAKTAEKVAIIGAGPAGLSCAHDLALLGYEVTVFEALEIIGGMLYFGIPEYRLPRDILAKEIEVIKSLGVKFNLGQKLGRDFTLKNLKNNGFAAIFISIGANLGRKLNIEGNDFDGVTNGLDFLFNVNLGYHMELGKRVVVVGGGNVALDVARTVIRGGLSIEDGSTLVDVARAALRLGAREVKVVSLESREELPAFAYEVEEAEKEGIIFYPSRGPKRILGRQGKAIGLETLDVAFVFDKEGRFNPSFISNTEKMIPADNVILAIGQTVDISALNKDQQIKLTSRGTIEIDQQTLQTSQDGVFAGGDCAFGPRIIIDAIADGKRAANGIQKYLSGETFKKKKFWFIDIGLDRSFENCEKIPRQEIPTLPISRRIGFREVELSYSQELAKKEASRCLFCHVETVFDSKKCILCGGCVDVCPENCLKIITYQPQEQNLNLEKIMRAFSFKKASFILKDEERCIRCGLCAKRCPTKAITMEELHWDEETILVK